MTSRLFGVLLCTPLALAAAPGERFDLRDFKLQENYIGSGGDTKDVKNLDHYEDSRFFFDDSDGAMVFKVCASDKDTLSSGRNSTAAELGSRSSSYPRTELRKTGIPDWTWNSGTTHAISATLKVPSMPSGFSTIIGQVHGDGHGGELDMLLKLRYQSSGQLEARVKTSSGDEKTAGDLGKVPLGSEIRYDIRCDGKTLHVTVNGKSVSYDPPTTSKQRFYLKAGNYYQDGSGSSKHCVEARFTKLQTSPSGFSPTPLPTPVPTPPSPTPTPSPSGWCTEGIDRVYNGVEVCCAKSCGQCGVKSDGCKNFPGGKWNCCADSLAEDGDDCPGPDDTGCKVPQSMQYV